MEISRIFLGPSSIQLCPLELLNHPHLLALSGASLSTCHWRDSGLCSMEFRPVLIGLASIKDVFTEN